MSKNLNNVPFYVLSFFKKGALFKGDIIQGRTLFKEIRFVFACMFSVVFLKRETAHSTRSSKYELRLIFIRLLTK